MPGWKSAWEQATGGIIDGHPYNVNAITFPTTGEDWAQTVRAVGLVDAATGGRLIGSLQLIRQINVFKGDSVEINADSFFIAF